MNKELGKGGRTGFSRGRSANAGSIIASVFALGHVHLSKAYPTAFGSALAKRDGMDKLQRRALQASGMATFEHSVLT
jgi:hypothetical protein